VTHLDVTGYPPKAKNAMRKIKKDPKVPPQKSFVTVPLPSNSHIPKKIKVEARQNKLYYGDNLEVLRKYIRDETVDLCYIDPPFNSKRNYNQIYNNIGKEDRAQAQAFVDTWTWDEDAQRGYSEITENLNLAFTHQSIDLILGLEKVLGRGSLLSYLVHMSLRIAEIHRVLKPNGSFYLHCDSSASHYLKIILDSIFCAGRKGQYQNEIVWKRTGAHSDAKQGRIGFGNVADVILFYSKDEKCTFNHQYLPHNEEYLTASYKYKDKDGRRYRLDNLTGPGGAAKGNPYYEFLGVSRYWRYSKEKMTKLFHEGRIIQTKPGNVPSYKRYLDESKGVEVNSVWLDIPALQSSNAERLGYPTQKPERLLERIINVSTNEGDIILDAYCGCGTTVAVAERLNRRWIGMDITYQSISLILKRLEEHFGISTLQNIEINGAPKDFASAQALANKIDDKTRKEFEKWAVLKYSNNRAAIHEKKGGDGGIDGVAYLVDYNEKGDSDFKQIIFSVKSDKTLPPERIRALYGTLEREKAAIGIMLTLYPMPNLVKESKKYGTYENKMFGHLYQKIEVISIQEILDGKTMKLPTSIEVLNKAEQKSKTKQQKLDF
jgi:DNA modification methylase